MSFPEGKVVMKSFPVLYFVLAWSENCGKLEFYCYQNILLIYSLFIKC